MSFFLDTYGNKAYAFVTILKSNCQTLRVLFIYFLMIEIRNEFKIRSYLRISIMWCLTHFPHAIELSNPCLWFKTFAFSFSLETFRETLRYLGDKIN